MDQYRSWVPRKFALSGEKSNLCIAIAIAIPTRIFNMVAIYPKDTWFDATQAARGRGHAQPVPLYVMQYPDRRGQSWSTLQKKPSHNHGAS